MTALRTKWVRAQMWQSRMVPCTSDAAAAVCSRCQLLMTEHSRSRCSPGTSCQGVDSSRSESVWLQHLLYNAAATWVVPGCGSAAGVFMTCWLCRIHRSTLVLLQHVGVATCRFHIAAGAEAAARGQEGHVGDRLRKWLCQGAQHTGTHSGGRHRGRSGRTAC